MMEGSGYTLRPLAGLVGLSHGTLNNWANGKGRANLDEVAKLAHFFGWTLDELYYGKGDAATMQRMAELEAFKRKALKLAADLLGQTSDQSDTRGLADDEGDALPSARPAGSGRR